MEDLQQSHTACDKNSTASPCRQVLHLTRTRCAVQKNHLSGLQQQLLRVVFWNSQQLMEVRREMQPIIRRNKNKANVTDAYKAFGPQPNSNAVKLQARTLTLQYRHELVQLKSCMAVVHQQSCRQQISALTPDSD